MRSPRVARTAPRVARRGRGADWVTEGNGRERTSHHAFKHDVRTMRALRSPSNGGPEPGEECQWLVAAERVELSRTRV